MLINEVILNYSSPAVFLRKSLNLVHTIISISVKFDVFEARISNYQGGYIQLLIS